MRKRRADGLRMPQPGAVRPSRLRLRRSQHPVRPLGRGIWRQRDQQNKYLSIGFFVAALGLWGLAVTVPNAFKSGDVVSAAKTNANFNALKSSVEALEAEVGSLINRVATLRRKPDPARQAFTGCRRQLHPAFRGSARILLLADEWRADGRRRVFQLFRRQHNR